MAKQTKDGKKHKKHHSSPAKQADQEMTVPEKVVSSMIGFTKSHKTKIIVSLITIVVIMTASFSFAVYYDVHERGTIEQYQVLMNEYSDMINEASPEPSKQGEVPTVEEIEASQKKIETAVKTASKTTAEKLLDLSEKSYWGYVKKYGVYLAAGMYYRADDYKAAKENYDLFLAKNRNNELVPLAMIQSAVCSEWMGNFDDAFNTYKIMEQDYQESGFLDQILYSLARVYQQREEVDKSKEYLNRVIAEFPSSSLAKKSRTRLMMLNYNPASK